MPDCSILCCILSVSRVFDEWMGPLREPPEWPLNFLATISENLFPAWRNENFISVYAILFPGMTGLMAGSMFINELRDQARDVPLGMFTAVGVCVLYNLIAVFISASTVLRDVSGYSMPTFNNITHRWEPFACAHNHTCSYGLMNFFQVNTALLLN
ncbi:unnamed protein product [Gongylonema pulchrum]|uniref:AA_permease domain-containing protein n=1 Tax=Gongylonema pulchrum TaxID=637853 RepID=A0A183ESL8_9BILA|nr:unnamed protein product [Gongylonema pulchrum]